MLSAQAVVPELLQIDNGILGVRQLHIAWLDTQILRRVNFRNRLEDGLRGRNGSHTDLAGPSVER